MKISVDVCVPLLSLLFPSVYPKKRKNNDLVEMRALLLLLLLLACWYRPSQHNAGVDAYICPCVQMCVINETFRPESSRLKHWTWLKFSYWSSRMIYTVCLLCPIHQQWPSRIESIAAVVLLAKNRPPEISTQPSTTRHNTTELRWWTLHSTHQQLLCVHVPTYLSPANEHHAWSL